MEVKIGLRGIKMSVRKSDVDTILSMIKLYHLNNPEQRFTQILFNLDINQFDNTNKLIDLRDNYNDKDSEIIKRIRQRLEYLNQQ